MNHVSDPVNPPRLARWLLHRLTPADRHEILLGDFEEGFADMANQAGARGARRWYWGQVLRSLPAFFATFIYGEGFMLKNYLRIASRNLARHKGYTAINIMGLAVGIACCVLIYLYVRDELAYDRFHENLASISRITASFKDITFSATPGPLGEALVTEYPEIIRSTRLADQDIVVRQGTALFQETVMFVDPAFLEIFTFPLTQGSTRALDRPDAVVLSAEMAEKYFGAANPLGQTLELRLGATFEPFVVTGVAAPIPAQSSITFDVLVPLERISYQGTDPASDWSSYHYATVVQFQNPAQMISFDEKMPAFIEKYMGAALEADDDDPADYGFAFAPMADYHLRGEEKGNAMRSPSNPLYSYILSGIALLVLLIACFNFVNLSMGRSATRMKEIGVRRALGALQGQLRRQFWIEAILLTGIALLIGLLLAGLALPMFNGLSGKELVLGDFVQPGSLLAFVGLLLFVGMAAGSYPAVALSRYEAVDVFQGKARLGGSNWFTRTLVVLQFFLSISLIVCAIVMVQQQQFLKTTNLGFDKEQVVVIPLQAADGDQATRTYEQLTQALARHDEIVRMTGSSPTLGEGSSIESVVEEDGTRTYVFIYRIDEDYLETLDIPLVAGRNFSPDFPADAEQAIIVNEAFVRTFGLENPVGSTFPHVLSRGRLDNPTIIGVVRDYHFQKLHAKIEPMYLHIHPDVAVRHASIRLAPGDVSVAMDLLADTWQRLRPDTPFDYYFLDETLDQQYRAEERWSTILRYAASLAIFIACLGLFGLTALTVTRRIKEVGIRKVLGASVSDVTLLLSKDFLKLVLIANVLAWPVAYIVMQRWLEDFSYRIDVSWWIFLAAGLATLLIAGLTVSYQAIKAALIDPAQTLRQE
ncbi:MAG TPA: ABC transporter permease [Rhodothermales bacterium]|nr:ABC transporter permease [Rhodothermales bacterium]